jgi:hypothetical protein
MMLKAPCVGACLILLLAPAGEAHAQAALSGQRRDSAGIQIIEHASIKTAPSLRIVDPPVVQLGGLQSDLAREFDANHPYLHAVQLSSGEIVVADMNAIKVFTASGQWQRNFGRKGQGPGEFAQIREVCAASGDTLMVFTAGFPNVDVFRVSGEFIRRFTAPPGRIAPDGCFGDGTVLHLGSARRPAGASSTTSEGELTVSILNTSGATVAPVGAFKTAPRDIRVPNTFNAVAHRQSVYMGDGREAAIREYTRGGQLKRIIRWQDERATVAPEIAQASVGGAAAGDTRGDAPARNIPAQTTVPAYADIKVDPSGRIWARAHDASRNAGRWTVFDSDGSLAGSVMLPASRGEATLLGFSRDGAVLLRWIDSDGAYRISQHRIAGPEK